MKIGIDFSPLQGPHRMRGIGFVTSNVIKNIAPLLTQKDRFVFYCDPSAQLSGEDAINALDISEKSYEIRSMTVAPPRRKLPGKLRLITKMQNKLDSLASFRTGVEGFDKTDDLDIFIQFDQSMPFPKLKDSVRKVLIIYDIIPYLLESSYLWSYTTSRQKGMDRRGAIAAQLRRLLYAKKLKANCANASNIIAISETTKKDFVDLLGVNPALISVITLGVSPPTMNEEQITTLKRYIETDWGPIPRKYTYDPSSPYLLFVGGADHRRKLDDLVAAFNQLRARDVKIKLFLAGDILKGADSIPIESTKKALKGSAYKDDIVYLGFVDDIIRDWLYRNALAFVFPSIYEGFGLPVLEAMSYGTPVISYKNAATVEVAGDQPFYAHDPVSIADAVETIMDMQDSERAKMMRANTNHTLQYSWQTTAQLIYELISANAKTPTPI